MSASNFSTDLVVYESLTNLPSWIIEQISYTLILTILFLIGLIGISLHVYL